MTARQTLPADAKPQQRFPRLRALWQRLRGGGSPAQRGVSVGLGLFVGCLPLYGAHLPLCLLLCLPLGLDVVLAYLAAQVSNPLFAPVLLALSIELGSWLLTGQGIRLESEHLRAVGFQSFFTQALLGGASLGALLGLGGGLAAFLVARRLNPKSDTRSDAATVRVRERYRSAKAADRYYVAAKLATDPVVNAIAALGPLGVLVDAGCGRGQLALYLWELGHTTAVFGFDFDARKVAVARTAAQGLAGVRFETGDVREQPLAAADTILLIDVLHYLPADEQDALLERAGNALRPAGRLVVREVDAAHATRSFWTRGLERVATLIGYNRSAASLHFRSMTELCARLEALGLGCEVEDAGLGGVLTNRLIVARRTRPA